MITKETIGVRIGGQKEKDVIKKIYIYYIYIHTHNGLWASENDNATKDYNTE